jgi:hypothetical protein
MRSGADARDADLLAAQIFEPLDFRLGENALSEMVLDPGDEDEIIVSADNGAHDADAAVDHDLRFAAEHRRSCQRRGTDIDQREFQIVLAKNSGFLGDPGHRLGHHPGGLHADQTIGARSRNGMKRREHERRDR